MKSFNAYALSVAALVAAVVLAPAPAQAARQFEGLCSQVKVELNQELALERTGFLATLEVTNNEPDAAITHFSSRLIFRTESSDEFPDGQDAADLFFVQEPVLRGVDDINGSGLIPPGQTGIVEWFIIPTVTAGGDNPNGLVYDISAELSASLYGNPIDPAVLEVVPDSITVLPEPQLQITYFQPRDVDGDNPFTPVVESPIPFTLGVLVKNAGYGTARKVRIVSEQPRIAEDEQGLLIVPQLVGSRIDDEPTDSSSLTVQLADIQPGHCRKAAWSMITTLSGTFTEFNASYEHAAELGGEATSIIQSIDAHFIVHEVLNDEPGRDGLLDFLAETGDYNDTGESSADALIPDTLFETDCNTLPVNMLADVEVTGSQGLTATVEALADFENWVFMRVADPNQARYEIDRVVRSDGKVLNRNNAWTHVRYTKPDSTRQAFLNIFDFVALGSYSYTVEYAAPAVDITPPITVIHYSGAAEVVEDITFIGPETEIFFISDDISPVEIEVSVDGEAFHPAFPFTIRDPGDHEIRYFARDAQGNEEAIKIAQVSVVDERPVIADVTLDTSEFVVSGDAVTVRPTEVAIFIDASTDSGSLEAAIDVYAGAPGYPQLVGVPADPSPLDHASIQVTGINVDFYQYRAGGGDWSGERPVSETIELVNLPPNRAVLEVRGRNALGGYSTASVTATWLVDPTGPAIRLSQGPALPSRVKDATFGFEGTELYRWRPEGGFYRAETAIADPLGLDHLADGANVIELIGREGGVWQDDEAPTRFEWTVDPLYGTRLPAETLVFHADVNPAQPFLWDGRTNEGRLVSADVYTVVVTLTDGLGGQSATSRLVSVDQLMPEHFAVDGAPAPQLEANGGRDWVVWQDQRAGNWDIWGRKLTDDPAAQSPSVELAGGSLNQQRPRTDGKYVVWEDRQADGTWDVWALDLETPGAQPFAVTATHFANERNPVVELPYVVYQSQPVGDPDAPWQLYVSHLVDGGATRIEATGYDQHDPDIDDGRVVWTDHRDVGNGEIYIVELDATPPLESRRLTNDAGGQFHPSIDDGWVIWSDNRTGLQLDLYGHHLETGVETQLTDTTHNETRPFAEGGWIAYIDDDVGGVTDTNVRLLNLANRASVQLTSTVSQKQSPSLAGGRVMWTDDEGGTSHVRLGEMPTMQTVFNNANAVAISEGVSARISSAFELLELWHEAAGVVGVRRYTQFVPEPVAVEATWQNGSPAGVDFALVANEFVWVEFGDAAVLDLGESDCTAPALRPGVNAIGYTCFPDGYSAFRMIRRLGLQTVQSIRLMRPDTGDWEVATVRDGALIGEDFEIPRVGVILIDMNEGVQQWTP